MITNLELDQMKRMTVAELEAVKMAPADEDAYERSEIANALILIIQKQREISELNGKINKWMADNRSYYADTQPPDSAPSAAPAAERVKLTAKQRDALEKAAHPNGVWNDNKDNQSYHANRAKLVILRALEKMGYVIPLDAGHTPWSVRFVITDAGKAALS